MDIKNRCLDGGMKKIWMVSWVGGEIWMVGWIEKHGWLNG